MADTEIIAISTTLGTSIGAMFTWLATRRKTRTDDQAAFRKDLLERVHKLEDRLDEERRDCQEQLDGLRGELHEEQRRCDARLEAVRTELKDELTEKLKRQAASIRAEYRRDLEERSSGE